MKDGADNDALLPFDLERGDWMLTPRSPITYERTSFECGMPRDLST